MNSPFFVKITRYAMMLFLVFVFAGLLFLGGNTLLKFLKGPGISDEPIKWGTQEDAKTAGDEEFSDSLIETKVEATVASANIYGGTMGGMFDGVCKDISVVAPVKCKQTPNSYTIFAQLAGGKYYCVDKLGFRGTVEKVPTSGSSCRQ